MNKDDRAQLAQLAAQVGLLVVDNADEQTWEWVRARLCQETIGPDATAQTTPIPLLAERVKLLTCHTLQSLLRMHGDTAVTEVIQTNTQLETQQTTLKQIVAELSAEVGCLQPRVDGAEADRPDEEEEKVAAQRHQRSLIDQLDTLSLELTRLERCAHLLGNKLFEDDIVRPSGLWPVHDALRLQFGYGAIARSPSLAMRFAELDALLAEHNNWLLSDFEMSAGPTERGRWDALVAAVGLQGCDMLDFPTLAQLIAHTLGTKAFDASASCVSQLDLLERKVADVCAVRDQVFQQLISDISHHKRFTLFGSLRAVAVCAGNGIVAGLSMASAWRCVAEFMGGQGDESAVAKLLDPTW